MAKKKRKKKHVFDSSVDVHNAWKSEVSFWTTIAAIKETFYGWRPQERISQNRAPFLKVATSSRKVDFFCFLENFTQVKGKEEFIIHI